MRFTLTSVVSSMLLGSAVATPVTLFDRDIEGRAVPVGQAIFKCTVPGTVALTFDDGPFQYSQRAMDLLRDGGNMKATFFVNGVNRVSNTQLSRHCAHPWNIPVLTTSRNRTLS